MMFTLTCPVCHDTFCGGCSVEPTDAEVLATRRAECARIFYAIESDAHDLAVVASRIQGDRGLRDSIADLARDAWLTDLEMDLDAVEIPGEWRNAVVCAVAS